MMCNLIHFSLPLNMIVVNLFTASLIVFSRYSSSSSCCCCVKGPWKGGVEIWEISISTEPRFRVGGCKWQECVDMCQLCLFSPPVFKIRSHSLPLSPEELCLLHIGNLLAAAAATLPWAAEIWGPLGFGDCGRSSTSVPSEGHELSLGRRVSPCPEQLGRLQESFFVFY